MYAYRYIYTYICIYIGNFNHRGRGDSFDQNQDRNDQNFERRNFQENQNQLERRGLQQLQVSMSACDMIMHYISRSFMPF
jgi:hypothetical protein